NASQSTALELERPRSPRQFRVGGHYSGGEADLLCVCDHGAPLQLTDLAAGYLDSELLGKGEQSLQLRGVGRMPAAAPDQAFEHRCQQRRATADFRSWDVGAQLRDVRAETRYIHVVKLIEQCARLRIQGTQQRPHLNDPAPGDRVGDVL